MAEETVRAESVKEDVIKQKLESLITAYQKYLIKIGDFNDYIDCAFNKAENSALCGNKAKYLKENLWDNNCGILLNFKSIFEEQLETIYRVCLNYEEYNIEMSDLCHEHVDYLSTETHTPRIVEATRGLVSMPGQFAPAAITVNGNPNLDGEETSSIVETINVMLETQIYDPTQTNAFVSYSGAVSMLSDTRVDPSHALNGGNYSVIIDFENATDAEIKAGYNETIQLMTELIAEYRVIDTWLGEYTMIKQALESNKDNMDPALYEEYSQMVDNIIDKLNTAKQEREGILFYTQTGNKLAILAMFALSGDSSIDEMKAVIKHVNKIGFGVNTSMQELHELTGLNISVDENLINQGKIVVVDGVQTVTDPDLYKNVMGRFIRNFDGAYSEKTGTTIPEPIMEVLYNIEATSGNTKKYSVFLGEEEYIAESIPTEGIFGETQTIHDYNNAYDFGGDNLHQHCYLRWEGMKFSLAEADYNNFTGAPGTLFKLTNPRTGEVQYVTAHFFNKWDMTPEGGTVRFTEIP